MKDKLRLNVGCGWRDFGADWVHIDGGDYPHLDYHNIMELPQQKDSVDLLYASHVIAYFDREEIVPLLSEWKRVLKPGGILRLATPNFVKYAELYSLGKISLNQCVGPLYGQMPLNNETIYHKTTYDFESLSCILKKLEMKEVQVYNLNDTEHAHLDDHSHSYIPYKDFENGTLMSLNVQCKK